MISIFSLLYIIIRSTPQTAAASIVSFTLFSSCAFSQEESFSFSYGYDQSTCFDEGELVGTHQISFDFRGEYDDYSVIMYAETGLNCLEETSTVVEKFNRRWPLNEVWSGILTVNFDQVQAIAVYSSDGDSQQYDTDSVDSSIVALGLGRYYGPFSLQAGINLIPIDFVGPSQGNSYYVAATYRTEEFVGGQLLFEGSIAAPSRSRMRSSALIRWSRPFEDTNASLVISWRYEGGLDTLVSPFSSSLPGGHFLSSVSDRYIALNIGIGWETQ